MLPRMRFLPYRFRLLLNSWQQADSFPFADALTQDQIQAVCERHDARCGEDTVFTPAIVLWGFLSQVIHSGAHRSCLAAVARIGVLLVAMGRPRCAQNSGPYCRARCRLPLPVIRELAENVAVNCEHRIPNNWLWRKRHVKTLDGTTVSMPDTQDNQRTYPQQASQKPGLGFPIARLVVVLSLATAMVRGMAMAAFQGKETGESSLLRELLDQFEDGDVALADKLFCSYFLIALLQERNVDLVTLLHGSRNIATELRCGQRLGKGEYRLTWTRPVRPAWMDQATYRQIPKTIELRLIQVKVTEQGFRPKLLNIVTTLTDRDEYSVEDIAELYRQRWAVELDIRAIKVSMGMDQLRCQTPDMVEKEVWTCLLAYNLIRQKLLQAAIEKRILPRHLSFTNALQIVAAAWMVANLVNLSVQTELFHAEIISLASQTVGNRPGRVEPRAVKRRPKPMRLLTMARDVARELLLKGAELYKKVR